MRQVEHCEIHMDTLPCSACQREEQLRTALTEAKEALEQGVCNHEHTRGGNDYLECADCGYEWDYRKESAADAWKRLASAALAKIERRCRFMTEPDNNLSAYQWWKENQLARNWPLTLEEMFQFAEMYADYRAKSVHLWEQTEAPPKFMGEMEIVASPLQSTDAKVSDEQQCSVETPNIRTPPPKAPAPEAEPIDFSCRVCGVSCDVAPDPPDRAVCPEHCPDHEYEYIRDERRHCCKTCGQEAPYDYYYEV